MKEIPVKIKSYFTNLIEKAQQYAKKILVILKRWW